MANELQNLRPDLLEGGGVQVLRTVLGRVIVREGGRGKEMGSRFAGVQEGREVCVANHEGREEK